MKFNKQRLAELQAARLPHMQGSDIAEPKEYLSEADAAEAKVTIALLDDYLKAFVKTDGMCICCGAQQGGGLMEAMFGTAAFRWGLTHGEGTCSKCGYPARAMHYIGPKKDEIVLRNFILQYHPDGLSFEKREE